MRRFLSLALVMTAGLSTRVLAGSPAPGTYRSVDLGGSMLTGNYTETWPLTKDDLSAGIVLAVDSWDGQHRATQWMIRCPQTVAPAVEVRHETSWDGLGYIRYERTWAGGTFWLAGNGPWGDGAPAGYTATIDSYVDYITWNEFGGQPDRTFTMIGDVHATARFDDYPGLCLVLDIATGRNAPWATKPGKYPPFVDGRTCTSSPSAQNGAWGALTRITLTIYQCSSSATPVERTTWGALKARYE